MLEPLESEIRSLHAMIGSERDPDGRAFAPLADAYRRAGESRKALGLLTDGLARLPDFASGHVVAARLYARLGLFAEGEIAARKVLELDPENVSAMASLVLVLEGTGRVEEAAELFSTLEMLEPEYVVEEGLTRPTPVVDERAPEPDEEPVLAMSDLAPDEDEAVLDVAALAPDEDEPVFDVAALAPDEDEPVFDVAAFAPDEDEPVLDVAALAPEDEEPVLAMSDLAPDPDDEPVFDVGALAPDEDEPVVDVSALAPESDSVPSPTPQGAPRILTRTLGDLYAKQGFVDRAVDVYRQLAADKPEDEAIAGRLRELEGMLDGSGSPTRKASAEPPSPEGADAPVSGLHAREKDEELEALARDLVGQSGERAGDRLAVRLVGLRRGVRRARVRADHRRVLRRAAELATG